MKKVFGIIKKLSPLLSAIPGVGPIIANVLDNNSTPAGVMDKKELWPQLVQLVILAVIIYFLLTGKITQDQAEGAKELLK